jgi:hypothetical protein
LAVLGDPVPARAGLFEVYGQVQAGGAFGKGSANAPAKDFFETVQGLGAGGEVGVEVLYVDLMVDHTQFFDDHLKASWTQFMAGVDHTFPMDDDHVTQGTIGLDAGYGIGTLQSLIDNPNAPVSRKGAVAELRVQGDRLLGRYAAVGLDLRLGYHFLTGAAPPAADPMLSTRSQGMHMFGGVAFKLHFGSSR